MSDDMQAALRCIEEHCEPDGTAMKGAPIYTIAHACFCRHNPDCPVRIKGRKIISEWNAGLRSKFELSWETDAEIVALRNDR